MKTRGGKLKTIKSVQALYALTLLGFGLSVSAQDQESAPEAAQSAVTTSAGNDKTAPLVVPVYPRFKPKKTPATIESLKDTYIVLDDGSVLSTADWLLGSLNKSNIGAGMSDYQNRLFLGQVARAAVGLDGDLLYRSFQDAGSAIPFVPHRPSESLQAVQGIVSYFVPGLAPNTQHYDKGFHFMPTMPVRASTIGYSNYSTKRSSGGSILFDDQFFSALYQTQEEFAERGKVMDIVARYERESAK